MKSPSPCGKKPSRQLLKDLYRYLMRQPEVMPDIPIGEDNLSGSALERLMTFRAAPWYEEFRAAVLRIELGRYGVCSLCHDCISSEWLDAYPMARFCRNCERCQT